MLMMIKKTSISPRDQELLSAYLDGQLTSKEITNLQRRLKDDREMQEALEGLRMTREALHSLPRLRAPRNFTLSPDMAGVRAATRHPVYPVFGFASLAASLLLVLVFVADRMNFLGTAQTAALESAAHATQMEEAVQTRVVEMLEEEGITSPEAEALVEMEAPMMVAGEADHSLMESSETGEELALNYPEPALENLAAPAVETTDTVASKKAPEATEAYTSSYMIESAEAVPVITQTFPLTPTYYVINGTEVLGVGGGPPEASRQSSTPYPEPSPTLSPTETSVPSPIPTEIPQPSDTLATMDASNQAGEELEMDLPTSEEAQPETSLDSQEQREQMVVPGQASQPSRSILMAVEFVLGFLAVGSAIIFVYINRKAS